MNPEEVRQLVARAFPGDDVTVDDITGTQDHFEIIVASGSFKGKTKIEQHRLVQAPLEEALEDGRIHAVKIKTIVPDSSQMRSDKQ